MEIKPETISKATKTHSFLHRNITLHLRVLKKLYTKQDLLGYCRRMKKPRQIDNFFDRHFKLINNSLSHISIQLVETILYDDNSTKRYRNILRHELELKWIRLLQTPHPLGYIDTVR